MFLCCGFFFRKSRSVIVPKNGIYFSSTPHISPHIGICHLKLVSLNSPTDTVAVNVLRFSNVREYLENFKLEIRTKKTFGDLTSFTDLNGQNSVLTVAENDSAGNSHLRLTDPILILAQVKLDAQSLRSLQSFSQKQSRAESGKNGVANYQLLL